MTTIVVIGNGFDIAHGLPTKYGDFMEYLLNSIVKTKLNRRRIEYEIKGQVCGDNRNFIHRLLENGDKDPWIGALLNTSTHNYSLSPNPHSAKSIYFKSLFNRKEKLGYWSDLEVHYFELLKKHKSNLSEIEILNNEFEHLKVLLQHYLQTEVEDILKESIGHTITKDHSIYKMLVEENTQLGRNENHHKLDFITFNYTNTILSKYTKWLKEDLVLGTFISEPIFIHGGLNSTDNPIIFGYGDDNSEEYMEIQNIRQDSLLKNFKTFQYLRSERYREVLAKLESNKSIYIQIIGHSCGITDKALLRTIFEHPNVKQIEVVYYESEKKYFENLYNISRIFSDNTLMREKLVPLSETFMILPS